MVKSGLITQPSGICPEVVCRILASLSFVQSHIRRSSPQSRRRCWRSSSVLQCRQRGDVIMLIRCNRKCVGYTSCMSRYQIIFISSATGASCRLCHIRTHAVSGYMRWTLISGVSGVSRSSTNIVV